MKQLWRKMAEDVGAGLELKVEPSAGECTTLRKMVKP
jgi:hypothetical protein